VTYGGQACTVQMNVEPKNLVEKGESTNMNEPLTDAQIGIWVRKLFKMDQVTMARLYRFSPPGHPVFDSNNNPLYEIFKMRFAKLGGLTPSISKEIGWGR